MKLIIFALIPLILSLGIISLLPNSNAEETKTIFIDSHLVDCVGVGLQKCMLVRDNQNSQWSNFYDNIEGFTFVEENSYQLLVKITDIENSPEDSSSLKYELLEIITKKSNHICIDKVWIENSKGKIACVTPSTANKLVQRGWGTLLDGSEIDFTPMMCTANYLPVCGVDEKTYGNLCNMKSSGVRFAYDGECQTNGIEFDVVIINGRVMDPETNFDEITNVGIKDGRIVSITNQEITGKETIDAVELVVSPGFIDTHFHGIDPFATRLGLLDGITTGMDMEVGAYDIAEFYKQREGNWKGNFGTTVSHEFSRMAVLDNVIVQDGTSLPSGRAEAALDGEDAWSTRISNTEESIEIFKILDTGLQQGAIGIGSTVGYMPKGVTAREMFEVQKLAGEYGRVTDVHTRFAQDPPPNEFVLGGQEILANAFVLDAPVLFAHINNAGWELSAEMLELARQRGLIAWGEIYPYEAGSTTINAAFLAPDRLIEQGLTPEENILDPATGEFLTYDGYLDMLENDPGHLIVAFVRPSEWVNEWVKLEGVTIAGDAMMGFDKDGNLLEEFAPFEEFAGHPRTAGTHAKSLKIARENEIPLMSVIGNLSYWSAKHLGDTGLESMKERGRIQEGMIADITIFDPQTVTDNSTYLMGENGFPPTGIPYVIVNGVIVVNDSQVLSDVSPGQSIRFPITE